MPTLLLAVVAHNQDALDSFEAALVAGDMLPNDDIEVCVASQNQDLRPGRTRLVTLAQGSSLFLLWAAAVQAGTAPFVALLDAACPPTPQWWSAARDALESGHTIFFGPVIPGWEATDRRLTGYLIEYAQFNTPLHVSKDEFPGNNLIFHRSLLNEQDLTPHGLRKTFFVNRLLRSGGPRPRPINAMAVNYRKPYDAARYRRRRYAHGRAYAAQVGAQMGLIRIWYAARSFALPVLRTWRIFRAVRFDRKLRRAALTLSADIILSECAWSVGEAAGFIAGSSALRLD